MLVSFLAVPRGLHAQLRCAARIQRPPEARAEPDSAPGRRQAGPGKFRRGPPAAVGHAPGKLEGNSAVSRNKRARGRSALPSARTLVAVDALLPHLAPLSR
jgi:hypothetical protein